jgi:hypothetical protein
MKNIDALRLAEELGETARRVQLAILAIEGLEISKNDIAPISELLLKVKREIEGAAGKIHPPKSDDEFHENPEKAV